MMDIRMKGGRAQRRRRRGRKKEDGDDEHDVDGFDE